MIRTEYDTFRSFSFGLGEGSFRRHVLLYSVVVASQKRRKYRPLCAYVVVLVVAESCIGVEAFSNAPTRRDMAHKETTWRDLSPLTSQYPLILRAPTIKESLERVENFSNNSDERDNDTKPPKTLCSCDMVEAETRHHVLLLCRILGSAT
jgi:hypothetical protein